MSLLAYSFTPVYLSWMSSTCTAVITIVLRNVAFMKDVESKWVRASRCVVYLLSAFLKNSMFSETIYGKKSDCPIMHITQIYLHCRKSIILYRLFQIRHSTWIFCSSTLENVARSCFYVWLLGRTVPLGLRIGRNELLLCSPKYYRLCRYSGDGAFACAASVWGYIVWIKWKFYARYWLKTLLPAHRVRSKSWIIVFFLCQWNLMQ